MKESTLRQWKDNVREIMDEERQGKINRFLEVSAIPFVLMIGK